MSFSSTQFLLGPARTVWRRRRSRRVGGGGICVEEEGEKEEGDLVEKWRGLADAMAHLLGGGPRSIMHVCEEDMRMDKRTEGDVGRDMGGDFRNVLLPTSSWETGSVFPNHIVYRSCAVVVKTQVFCSAGLGASLFRSRRTPPRCSCIATTTRRRLPNCVLRTRLFSTAGCLQTTERFYSTNFLSLELELPIL